MALSVGVVGASGYAGAELLRILAAHPAFSLEVASAYRNAGQPITSLYPNLASYSQQSFGPVHATELAGLDLVFLALPHGASAQLAEQLTSVGKVVDLGADHRLADASEWERYYGETAAAPQWTYGLPELPGRRDLVVESDRVANPGCYATAMQLAAAPLLAAGLADPQDVVVVAASGTSGAGRVEKAHLLASEVMGSMSAYKVGGIHPHTAEVCQELTSVAGKPVTVSFTPTLAPMSRGILATTTLKMRDGHHADDVRGCLVDEYQDELFVSVLPVGQWPTTAATFGTNGAHVQVAVDERAGRIIVVSAIDNLGKGAAGQAIQNANLMVGIPESTGLTVNGVSP